jgi:hypothetical protein
MDVSVTTSADPSRQKIIEVRWDAKKIPIQGQLKSRAISRDPRSESWKIPRYVKSTSLSRETVRADLEHRPETRIPFLSNYNLTICMCHIMIF